MKTILKSFLALSVLISCASAFADGSYVFSREKAASDFEELKAPFIAIEVHGDQISVTVDGQKYSGKLSEKEYGKSQILINLQGTDGAVTMLAVAPNFISFIAGQPLDEYGSGWGTIAVLHKSNGWVRFHLRTN